jgi:hypothetical protein
LVDILKSDRESFPFLESRNRQEAVQLQWLGGTRRRKMTNDDSKARIVADRTICKDFNPFEIVFSTSWWLTQKKQEQQSAVV